jgi:hypothetical protein
MSTERIEPPLSEVMAVILRRRDEALAHPELLEPWGDTTERLRGQLKEIRRQKFKPIEVHQEKIGGLS